MTPNEIATSIADLGHVDGKDVVGLSTNYTYCFGRLDDSNTWD